MSTYDVFKSIKAAIDGAERNCWSAELHLQVIKHANSLRDISGREFCAAIGIKPSFGTEFLKMKKIAGRLLEADLDVSKI